MRTLQFEYSMEISYSLPAGIGHYTLKCIPMNTARQQLMDHTITIEPEHTEAKGEDSFGNSLVYGMIPDEHERFSCHICGSVVCGSQETAGAQGCYESLEQEGEAYRYRYPHGLNKSGEALSAAYREIADELNAAGSDHERGLWLTHWLYGQMSYTPGVTAVSTTAEEAWALRQGVCQDYAHIFIALAHLHGMTARYVTGLIEGEGASHAWAELLCGGKWYGYDPTNDMPVDDRHIKIGHGRDAADCQINRGVMKGGGLQTQTISVSVYEKSE